MYSQFSEVRFSSVALATGDGQCEAVGIPLKLLTDDFVKSVLLSAKHWRYDRGMKLILAAGVIRDMFQL
jgi:hypothetical protein